MMSLASGIEPLRAANEHLRREDYRWHLLSPGGAPVRASNNLAMPTEAAIEHLADLDCLIVCAGKRVDISRESASSALLRQAARRGLVLGSLSTGATLLAAAGLLEGYRCTIHWEGRAAFDEDFGRLASTGNIYEIDRDRLTCSGGTAAMDMMLELLREAHGDALARAIANQFHHERIRAAHDPQRGGRAERLATTPATLRTIAALMSAHLETPLTMDAIAERSGSPLRRTERLFRKHLGVTPLRYYLELRLDRARELILYSDMSVFEVAVAAGFSSTSHMAGWFRKVFGQTPGAMRDT